jgi:hypothetical protein
LADTAKTLPHSMKNNIAKWTGPLKQLAGDARFITANTGLSTIFLAARHS